MGDGGTGHAHFRLGALFFQNYQEIMENAASSPAPNGRKGGELRGILNRLRPTRPQLSALPSTPRRRGSLIKLQNPFDYGVTQAAKEWQRPIMRNHTSSFQRIRESSRRQLRASAIEEMGGCIVLPGSLTILRKNRSARITAPPAQRAPKLPRAA